MWQWQPIYTSNRFSLFIKCQAMTSKGYLVLFGSWDHSMHPYFSKKLKTSSSCCPDTNVGRDTLWSCLEACCASCSFLFLLGTSALASQRRLSLMGHQKMGDIVLAKTGWQEVIRRELQCVKIALILCRRKKEMISCNFKENQQEVSKLIWDFKKDQKPPLFLRKLCSGCLIELHM